MKIKRVITIAFAALLIMQLIAAQHAFADEQDSSRPIKNADGTLTLTSTYFADADVPTLPVAITFEGEHYTLEDTMIGTDTSFNRPTQTFRRTLFSEVPLEDINSLGSYFPSAITINEGDFQGEVRLDAIAPYTVVERYEAFRAQVDRETTFTNLPDNDVSRIPTYQEYEVSSSDFPGATTTATLQVLGVSYVVAGTDHLGLPNNFTAYVTYRGQEEYLQLHHYDVTANYSGEIVSSVEQMAVTGNYSPITSAPVEVISDNSTPLVEAKIPITEVILALTAAAAAGVLIFLFILRRLPFKVCYKDGDKIKIAQRRSMKIVDDHYVVKIKPEFNLSYDEDVFGVLPQRYQEKDMNICVYQGSECVYRGNIALQMPLINAESTYGSTCDTKNQGQLA